MSQPPGPTTIIPWVVDFPLDDLDFRPIAKSTRAPTSNTLGLFYDAPQRGIRVVWDPSVNDRLSQALEEKIQEDALVPEEVASRTKWEHSVRWDAREAIIERESTLSAVMMTNFFRSATLAIKYGLPSEFHGTWEDCADSHSSATDWVFTPAVNDPGNAPGNAPGKAPGKAPVDPPRNPPRAIIELTLPSILTVGEQEQDDLQGLPSGDRPGEHGDDFEDVAGGKVHLKLKLELLVEACKRKEGLRLVLKEKPKSSGLTLCVLDENGVPEKGMSHWAYGLSQLWEQLLSYDLELVTLSSYNVWIPLERDTDQREILRMGSPIHRKPPGTAPRAGQMSPLQLAMAVVIPTRPPMESLGNRFSKLPVSPLSGPSIQEIEKRKEGKMKKMRKITGQDAVSGRSKTKKRGRGQRKDDGDGRGDAAGYGALSGSGVKLLAVALHMTVLKPRSPCASHFFRQVSLDDSDLAGCIVSTIATPLNGDSAPLAQCSTANLALVSYLGSGRLWDAYAAVLTGDGLRTTELVAKVSCPYTYDMGNPSTQELFEDSREAVRAYHREAALYRGALAELQGGAVPLVYGSFEGAMCLSLGIHGGFEILVELLENVGKPAAGGKDLRSLPLQDKLEIEDLYRQLHAVRVLHRDVEPRHIRRRADGRFAIIDFDSSREVKPDAEGDRQLASELRRVRWMLGLHDRPVPPQDSH